MNMRDIPIELQESVEQAYKKPYMQVRQDQAERYAVELLTELKTLVKRYEFLRHSEGMPANYSHTAEAIRLINLCEPGL